jgi:UDP-3-O-[3-hydroxymyristoyl] glucosamine N-acyltransferase
MARSNCFSLKDLIKQDTNLTFVSGDLNQVKFSHLSAVDEISDGAIVFIGNLKLLNRLGLREMPKSFNSIALVVSKELLDHDKLQEFVKKGSSICQTENIALSICTLSKFFYTEKFKNFNYVVDGRQLGQVEIDPSSSVAQHVFIGSQVRVGKNVVIMSGCRLLGEIEIADDVIIYPNVTIYPNVKIGQGSIIHANSVIGSDGYGYNFAQGVHHKIYHLGGVEISSHVEIGSNSSIDQGVFYPTRVGSGTKIDNLVQVAHNVQIGQGVIICGQVGIAGSCEIGDYTVIGGQAAIGPHVKLGKACQIAGGAGVSDATIVADNSKLGGHPARPLNEWLRSIALLRKLAKTKN